MLAVKRKKEKKEEAPYRGESNKTASYTTKGFHFISLHFKSFQEQRSEITREGSHSLEEVSQKLRQMASTQRQKKTTSKKISSASNLSTPPERTRHPQHEEENLIRFPPARNNEGHLHRSPPNSLFKKPN